MWNKEDINLGKIAEKSNHNIEFTYVGDIEVKAIKTSCGCTNAEFDSNTGVLSVNYNAGSVPKHLEYKGEFVTKKQIRVETTEGVHLLSFRATIKKDL